jgi:hypothetical protein
MVTEPGDAQAPEPPVTEASTVDASPRSGRRAASRAIRWVLIGLTLLAFVCLTWAIAVPKGDSEADPGVTLGYALGTALGALAGAAAALWLFRRLRRRPGPLDVGRVLLLAAASLAVAFVGRVSTASVPVAPDPTAWLRDASPYTLAPVTADEAAAMSTPAPGIPIADRQVLDHGNLVGIVRVVTAAKLDPTKELAAFESTVPGAAGTGQQVEISGRPAVLVHTGTTTELGLVDRDEYLVAVVAADDATAESIATALATHAP